MSSQSQTRTSAENQKLLSATEAAERLNLPIRTVQRLLKNRALPAFRYGRKWRIPEAALDTHIAAVLERAKSNANRI